MSNRVVTLANRDDRRLTVDAAENLLDALLAQGVDLPYACRYGGCITCAARLTEGAVDQALQVALNERQLREGFIVLCVAKPLTDCTLEVGVDSHDGLYRNPFLSGGTR